MHIARMVPAHVDTRRASLMAAALALLLTLPPASGCGRAETGEAPPGAGSRPGGNAARRPGRHHPGDARPPAEMGHHDGRAREEHGGGGRQPARRPAAERAADGAGVVAARRAGRVAGRRTRGRGPQRAGAGDHSRAGPCAGEDGVPPGLGPGGAHGPRMGACARPARSRRPSTRRRPRGARRTSSRRAPMRRSPNRTCTRSAWIRRRSMPCSGARGSLATASSTMSSPTPT